jgi:hypothetical protein
MCSLTVTLPMHTRVYVAAGRVRWVHEKEYRIKTLVMDDESREDLYQHMAEN